MDNMTAKVSLFARGYHYENNRTHIFADTVAKQLLGSDYDQIALNMSQGIGFFMPDFKGSADEGLRLIVDKQLSPSVLARSAFCEEILKGEREEGCNQYVIFASGYDTYAIRNTDQSMAVYELDLPDMIADKRTKVEKAGLGSGAVYVPCNLSDHAWKERLFESGFDSEKRVFCSLLGISYYLDKNEFKMLIDSISGITQENLGICLDFPANDGAKEVGINKSLARGAGEQMRAEYTSGEMESILLDRGFTICEHLDSERITDRYFTDYNKNNPINHMSAPRGVEYLYARKPVRNNISDAR